MPNDARPEASDKNATRRPNRRWRQDFIEHLAQTSNIRQSADVANISPSQAYRARANEPEFARSWLAALWEGYEHLEMEVLRRLREGDQQTGDASKYDFANAIRLLSAHRESAAKAQAEQRNVSAAEVRSSIDRKVEEIRLRIQREKRTETSS